MQKGPMEAARYTYLHSLQSAKSWLLVAGYAQGATQTLFASRGCTSPQIALGSETTSRDAAVVLNTILRGSQQWVTVQSARILAPGAPGDPRQRRRALPGHSLAPVQVPLHTMKADAGTANGNDSVVLVALQRGAELIVPA